MRAKEFMPIWKTFCGFYNAADDNEVQIKIYFEAFEYLPAVIVERIFKNAMKAERGFGSIPTIQQIEPHRDAAVSRRNSKRPKYGEAAEPPLPDVIMASNLTFLKLITETQTKYRKAFKDGIRKSEEELKQKALERLCENGYPEYWAKFYHARRKLERESECDPYWRLRQERFEKAAAEVSTEFLTKVRTFMVGTNDAQKPSGLKIPLSPEDVPF